MYLLVGDVMVCYRCQAHYRGFPAPRIRLSNWPPANDIVRKKCVWDNKRSQAACGLALAVNRQEMGSLLRSAKPQAA